MKKLALPFQLLLTMVLVVACATSPKGRRQLLLLPGEQLDSMGVQAFNEMKSQQKVSSDARTNNYVKCVANAITDAMDERRDWEVVVFQEDSANAFALPGGKIGVHTGLLKVAKNQDQLAAVVGHEVGHVIAQHGNERVSEQLALQGGLGVLGGILSSKGKNYDLLMAGLGVGAQFGVLLPHSRTQESEADVIGLDLMAKAGFNPRESVSLWENMGKESGGGAPPEFMSTHPSHGTRIENLTGNMANAEQIYNSAARKPNCKL